MLKNLRRIHFPSDLQTSGPIIPARLLNHVADHAAIVRKAEETAEKIREHAEQEARQIRETARERMAASMRRDLDSLKSLTQRKEENLLLNSSKICVQICKVVFDQMIEEMTTQQRIETLVNNLLKANHHGRSLLICSHEFNKNASERMPKPLRIQMARPKKLEQDPTLPKTLWPGETMRSTKPSTIHGPVPKDFP